MHFVGCINVLGLLLVLFWMSRGCWGLQCAPCERQLCAPQVNCTGGLVLDVCACCHVCARVLDEVCGGLFGLHGRCGEGLLCVTPPGTHLNQPSTDQEGICKPIPSVLSEGSYIPDPQLGNNSSCASVTCPPVFILQECPGDSHRVGGGTAPGECCPTPPRCHCKACPHERLECPPSKLLRMTRRGLNVPGNCCDVYECQDIVEACEGVQCDPDPLANVTCPPDSYPLPILSTHGGCCLKHQGCSCLPEDRCRSPSCPEGSEPRVVSFATGLPGRCCNQTICHRATCMDNGRLMMHGMQWERDKCTICECQAGLTKCRQRDCPDILECGWAVQNEGDCCPTCQGCLADDGEQRREGELWNADQCTSCRCLNGQIFCETQLCEVYCLKPKKQPGRCCATCDDDDMRIPDHCPDQILVNCSIHCPNGLELDGHGCPLCECKSTCDLKCPYGYQTDVEGNEICECKRISFCPSIRQTCHKRCRNGYELGPDGCPHCHCLKCPDLTFCWKKCPHGFKTDAKGCKICECEDPELTTEMTTFISTTPSGATCMSSDGRSRFPGETWFDGCRQCSCIQGREMCALIMCPTPSCQHPILQPGDCCHSCPGEPTGPEPTAMPRCPTGAAEEKQNEVWSLDKCTQCLCHGGAILCETKRCPPLLCHHALKLPGHCCAVCADNASVVPPPRTTKGRACRNHEGTFFSDGDVWRTSPCQSCACIDGQIHCFSQTCPPLTCNKTVLRKGQCCPLCEEGESSGACVHEGRIYKSGEVWNTEPCVYCTCQHGSPECSRIQCPNALPPCKNLVHSPNHCCPICKDDPTLPPMTTPGSGVGPPKDRSRNFISIIAVLVALLLVFFIALAVLAIIVIYLCRRAKRRRDTPVMYGKNHQKNILYAEEANRSKATNVAFGGYPYSNITKEKYEICDEKTKLHDETHDSGQFPDVVDVSKAKPSDSESDHTSSTETKKTDLDESVDCCDSGDTGFSVPSLDEPDCHKALLTDMDLPLDGKQTIPSHRSSMADPDGLQVQSQASENLNPSDLCESV